VHSISDGYYLVAVGTLIVSVLTGWASGRLFKTKTIKDIVTTANDTINLYEARETALEDKIDSLEAKIDLLTRNSEVLQASLQKALAQNEILQNLLMRTGVVNVSLPTGVQTVGPDAPKTP
jgi:peptidoglycan hydrolase CwlO-like protein